jgi:hypothetical protein
MYTVGSTRVIGMRDMPSIYDNIAVIKRQLREGKKKSAFLRKLLLKKGIDDDIIEAYRIATRLTVPSSSVITL